MFGLLGEYGLQLAQLGQLHADLPFLPLHFLHVLGHPGLLGLEASIEEVARSYGEGED